VVSGVRFIGVRQVTIKTLEYKVATGSGSWSLSEHDPGGLGHLGGVNAILAPGPLLLRTEEIGEMNNLIRVEH